MGLAQPVFVPAEASRPVLHLVESSPKVPWRLPGVVRWGGIWGVALSMQGDGAPKPSSQMPDVKPALDDLRRMLEDAERDHRELTRRSPSWYENPFSPDVIRHHARLMELALWIERLKLEIDLKEWEEAKAVALQDPSTPPVIENKEIARLRQAISEHATQSEREQGAMNGIMASASTGGTQSATPDAKRNSEPVDLGGEPDSAPDPKSVPEGAVAVLKDYSVGISNQYSVALHITDGVIDQASITGIQAIRELIPNDRTDVQVHVTDAMPDQVSDWQYAWLDRTFDIIESHKPALRDINDRVRRGLPLTAEQASFLGQAQEYTQLQVDRYTAENQALSWVNHHLPKTPGSKAMQMAIGAAIHNSQPSWATLMGHTMLIDKLQQGRAVPDEGLRDAPKVAATSLNTIMNEALAQAMAELTQNHVTPPPDINALMPPVRISLSPQETRKLVGIFANLMGNGGRYCDPDKADRWLLAGAQVLLDGGVEVTIEDNGQGMTTEFVQHRLGQFRSQEGKKQVARSSGIGLWSAFEDARKLGLPPLQVKSAERVGSAFRVIIPSGKVKWQEGLHVPTVDRTADDMEAGFVVPDAAKSAVFK